ncbi:hypothetical protein KY290_001180 [Solanum tuberosum]|uniref:Uncharacterized protein n=1 Tax=Solanum tuberosum TaxID=4113 RepID=A0ABQ7WLF3_SOLTU|nr:hypothetical protein KY290_001180 [Solanum tuberosum]
MNAWRSQNSVVIAWLLNSMEPAAIVALVKPARKSSGNCITGRVKGQTTVAAGSSRVPGRSRRIKVETFSKNVTIHQGATRATELLQYQLQTRNREVRVDGGSFSAIAGKELSN